MFTVISHDALVSNEIQCPVTKGLNSEHDIIRRIDLFSRKLIDVASQRPVKCQHEDANRIH